jgi:hypothetical protein
VNLRSSWDYLSQIGSRFGSVAALQYALYTLVNKAMFFECFHVIVLDRDRVRPLEPTPGHTLSYRLATLQDLESMRLEPRWDISDERMRFFKAGDCCVLSLVDGRLAGYTWVHADGRPELMTNLVIAVPTEYLYNYAGLTLPEFRGAGLQPYRHHVVLNHERWRDRKGLIGYVRYTNRASQKGQDKSGYRRIGSIWLLGSRRRFWTHFSRSLRDMGIKRL